MDRLERLPFTSQKAIFAKLASVADIDKLKEPTRSLYLNSLKAYRDTYTIIKEEREEGRAEGRAEEKKNVARTLKSLGQPISVITQAT